MIDIVNLEASTFGDFIRVLQLRGDAPEAYYRWKYLDQPDARPGGFIAYHDKKPVGCIGVMHRIYVDANDKERRATWFADWFVDKSVRSRGVGSKLLEKVREISPYGFGIPGPSKAQAVAKQVGYGFLHENYYDYFLLVRPYKFGIRQYSSDGPVKSKLRGMFYSLRYSNTGKRRAARSCYEILPPAEFAQRILQLRSRSRHSLLINSEFVDWFAKMPRLPNGNKRYWHFSDTETGHSLFGFSELDNRKLMRTTLLYYNGVFPDDKTLFKFTTRLREDNTDYLHIFAGDLTGKLKTRFFVINKIPLTTLNSNPLRPFSLDRENIWYSQQIMK